MTVYRLGPDPQAFPDPDLADENGLLAVGGDLSPQRLLAAYANGIFPWYGDDLPILWHSPDPRFVLKPDKLHVPKSLRKTMKRREFEVRFDTAFAEVISACSETLRPGQKGTWITDDMRQAYVRLHQLGFAHSAETFQGGRLVGGVYGVSLGSAYFGESMFAHAPEASKVAFVTLVEKLQEWQFTLIDCQVETEHLTRFGAEHWPRRDFLAALDQALTAPTRHGSWT
ncbi:MAG: leucyl/phenylalanyl-tRNA--protein transferase [Myxococcaceae bacterium]